MRHNFIITNPTAPAMQPTGYDVLSRTEFIPLPCPFRANGMNSVLRTRHLNPPQLGLYSRSFCECLFLMVNTSNPRESQMRHTFQAQIVAISVSVAVALSAAQRLSAAEPAASPAAKPSAPVATIDSIQFVDVNTPSAVAKPTSPGANPWLSLIATTSPVPPAAAAKPSPQNAAATLEKLKNLGTLLGRALDLAVHLMSGNEADLLSKNTTALLSGNKPEILSGNKPAILSGNKPAVLSGNNTKVLSENETPIFSGNTFSFLSNIKIEIHINNSAGAMAQPPRAAAARSASTVAPPVSTAPYVAR